LSGCCCLSGLCHGQVSKCRGERAGAVRECPAVECRQWYTVGTAALLLPLLPLPLLPLPLLPLPLYHLSSSKRPHAPNAHGNSHGHTQLYMHPCRRVGYRLQPAGRLPEDPQRQRQRRQRGAGAAAAAVQERPADGAGQPQVWLRMRRMWPAALPLATGPLNPSPEASTHAPTHPATATPSFM